MGEDAVALPGSGGAARSLLHDPAERRRLAMEAGRMGSWAWDIPAGEVTGDPVIGQFFGLQRGADRWEIGEVFRAIHEDDVAAVRANLAEACETGKDFAGAFRVIHPRDGRLVWIGSRGRVVQRQRSGEPLLMLGVNWDATAQKQQEQRLSMLASEMNHRVKNAFAVMRSLIRMAGKSAADPASLATTLEAQAIAMAEAHAMSAKLSRAEGQQQVAVADLLRSALAPWIADGAAAAGRVRLDIDDAIELSPSGISSMAMLIYELTTNATKYGPLGEKGGTLDVALARETDGGMALQWIETVDGGIPPDPSPPDAGGQFGTVLLRQCAASLGAAISREFTPSGLHVLLRVPAGEKETSPAPVGR